MLRRVFKSENKTLAFRKLMIL